MGPEDVNMSRAVAELGLYTERVTEPSDVAPALERAMAANGAGQPAYLEFICAQYPRYGGFAPSSIAH
jgi:thiamine pyrophosphate-dependent acetolactate synthase large subunit-like protein